ncbi:MAG: hypothetical protein HY814_04840 [Candidatus Riflebacteria bacterium]|nr:hypothetical protein [Candidatus Riflebacteria bacterium]
MRATSGFSMVEVLVCIGILTFGLLPVVSMYQSTTKKGGLSEFHIFFQARAVRIVEFYSSYNYDFFRNALLSAGGGTKAIPLPIEGKIADPALPVEYSRMLADGKYEERCTIQFEENSGVDLVRLSVDLQWKFPLDDRIHSYSLARLFSRPDITLSDNELVYTADGPTGVVP